MTKKNRHANRSRIPEAKFRQLVKLFCLDLTATQIAAIKDYIMGFLTAFNVQMPETYRVSGHMTLDEILTWLDDYCQLKPVTAFEQVLVDFIIENRDERMKRSPSKYRR